MEVRFEDRFEDQHQAGLNNPVGNGRDPEPPVLARPLRDQPFLHRCGNVLAGLELLTQPGQEVLHSVGGLDGPDGQPVHPGRACTRVRRHPLPCDQQKGGVHHEVEQVIEPGRGVPT